ncbi:fibroblast growth factor 1 [Exaiptasia diaphana]|uniref:FGF n=1 Tax=Exaiptasia diaphana TaxID=2652724 RepID=A0A913YVF6_EXADI|nr:fibroblast growth factor 1 [Exaiptasia diaphana]XP_028519042.1 fibroblast growth factor 1 [Exaiptasia diaphana]XP_028519043.1 fibroblast growth factor 1 [Exaiptasia diaphana]KXJ22387.1 Fibroblast growth factor 4 [Exaiptasia diaphana]
MEQASFFATVLILAVLQCQSAPATQRSSVTPLKVPSSNSASAVKSKSVLPLLKKLKAKLAKKKTEKSSCNTRDVVKPPSIVLEKMLYSERRFLIQMKTGQVDAVPVNSTTRISNPWVVFEVESVGNDLFRAKGKRSALYLSMDKKGKFYGTAKPTDESVFKQIHDKEKNHGFIAFESYKYCSKYIGMKKNGHLKTTHRLNHSTHFLLL